MGISCGFVTVTHTQTQTHTVRKCSHCVPFCCGNLLRNYTSLVLLAIFVCRLPLIVCSITQSPVIGIPGVSYVRLHHHTLTFSRERVCTVINSPSTCCVTIKHGTEVDPQGRSSMCVCVCVRLCVYHKRSGHNCLLAIKAIRSKSLKSNLLLKWTWGWSQMVC